MDAGECFVFCDSIPDDHLWVVISDPQANPTDPVVIVNLTTYRSDKDCTCILEPGDHAFVRHRTVVHYGGAYAVPTGRLDEMRSLGELEPQPPLSPALLGRVRDGAGRSEFTPEGCRKILVEEGLIE